MGDCQRVRAAFDHLEASGIVARMNFTCCQICGHAEIGAERAEESVAREIVSVLQDQGLTVE